MQDKMLIDKSKVVIFGKKSKVLLFDDIDKVDIFMRDLFCNVFYNNIELVKKVEHKDGKGFSYLKINDYTREDGIKDLKLVVYKEYINIIKNIINDFDYIKKKNKQKVLK